VCSIETAKPVIEMVRSASVSDLGSEFDDFLFAPIGDDRNGMRLTVLSALARLDVDPWQEAAKLARLPGAAAAEKLASLIMALPDGPSAHRDPGTIAARLIALLPAGKNSNVPSRKRLLGFDTATRFQAAMCVIVCATLMVLMVGAEWIEASRQPPPQVDTALAPASGAVFSQMPPPNSTR
jgi:hypothetical protein